MAEDESAFAVAAVSTGPGSSHPVATSSPAFRAVNRGAIRAPVGLLSGDVSMREIARALVQLKSRLYRLTQLVRFNRNFSARSNTPNSFASGTVRATP